MISAVVVAAVVALLVPIVTLPWVTRLARHLGAVSTPRSDRLHRQPVPILGGLALTVGIVGGSLIIEIPALDRIALLLGIAAMALLGLSDDLGSLSARYRLLLEAAVGAAFATAVSGELAMPLRVAAIAVATACFPVAINATNLVDNADGLASLLSAVSGIALAGIVAVAGIQTSGGALGIVVAAACVGFLSHNRPPARVFMGDSGSLMLGFALAACSFLIVRDAVLVAGKTHIAAAIAIPLVWSFQVGDLAMVFVTRLRRRSSPFQGGVDHTSHRLLGAGLGPTAMLLALSIGAAAVGAIAVALAAWAGDFRLVALAAIAAAVLVGVFETVVAWRLPYARTVPPPAQRAVGDPAPGAIVDGSSR